MKLRPLLAGLALAAAGLAATALALDRIFPPDLSRYQAALERGRRRQRPPAARLHHGRRQVAAEDHGRRRRPALSRAAQGLRGPPLRRALGHRPAGGGARRRAVDHARPHRVGRLDDLHAGRPPAPARPAPDQAAQPPHQGHPVGARAAARMALLQARGAGDLSHPGADGRQSRRRARRLLRLFRQGAHASSMPPRPPCWWPSRSRPSAAGPTARRRPPRPRAIACWTRGLEHGVIDRRCSTWRPAGPVPDRRLAMPLHAPHLAAWLAGQSPGAIIPTTIRLRAAARAGAARERRARPARRPGADRHGRARQSQRLASWPGWAAPISSVARARSTWCAPTARPARR